MKLLVEQYGYEKGKVAPLLDSHYYSELKDGVQIPYVGYFLSQRIPDTVFILPKVFIIDGKAFGKYKPEDVIDFDHLEATDKKMVFALSVWIYRAIKLYFQRKQRTADTTEVLQNVVSHHGTSSETMIDIVLSLLKFHKEHQNLFTYITRVRHSGQNKIHWQKTISRTQAVMQNGKPVYLQPQTRRKEVNYDEELIVLFFSVLNYIDTEFHFGIRSTFGYELIRPDRVREMITSGKGLRLLRQNRRKYFTDEMVQLWNLLFTFFEQSEEVQSKRDSSEQAMLVRDFNLVFEDMIDSLIGENKLPRGLQKQKDGKIIDHIYRDQSLIDTDGDVYFIGDSKYYSEGNEVGENSIYKQFTYAKNVIQFNVDVFNNVVESEEPALPYIDTKTEGYNITPNFFIRGQIKKDGLNDYADSQLDLHRWTDHKTGKETSEYMSYHFENRLFDRDTLILQSYNINFLFVLAAYVQGAGEHTKKIRDEFRKNVKEVLARRYQFYALKPKMEGEAESYLKENFQKVLGKVYAPYDKEETNCLSLALDNQEEYAADNKTLCEELDGYFYRKPVAQSQLDQNPEDLFDTNEQTRRVYAPTGVDKSAKIVLTGLVNAGDAYCDLFTKHRAKEYEARKFNPSVNFQNVKFLMPMVKGSIDGYYEVEKISFSMRKEGDAYLPCLKLKLGTFFPVGTRMLNVYQWMRPNEMLSIDDVVKLYYEHFPSRLIES